MPGPEVLLPGVVLFTKFLLKLFVDRSPSLVDGISATLALPVDVVFLAMSLMAAFTIANPSRVGVGVLFFGIFVATAVVSVVLWRRSDDLFISDRFALTWTTAVCNYLLSSAALVIAVTFVVVGSK